MSYPKYFSGYEKYGKCPLSYLYKYGHPEVDAGWGVGEKFPKDLRAKQSRHHAVFGQALALAMENFYNHQYWKDPSTARQKVKSDALVELRKELRKPKNYIDWHKDWTPESKYDWQRCSPPAQVEKEILESCDTFLDIVKINGILSVDAEAEGELFWETGEGFTIGSRPDLTYTRKDGSVEIVDGKNSRTIGRYNNDDQLLWYCLVHWKVRGVMPQHASFMYFRHPPDGRKYKRSLWTGLVRVEVTEQTLQGVWERIQQFVQNVEDKKFEPVVAFGCRMCEFNTHCPAYAKENAPIQTKKVGKFVEIL